MADSRELTNEEEQWIKDRYPNVTTKDVANYLNCHRQTASKILTNLGLNKYKKTTYTPMDQDSMYRIRKCLVCKEEKRLHKNCFICSVCRGIQRSQGYL